MVVLSCTMNCCSLHIWICDGHFLTNKWIITLLLFYFFFFSFFFSFLFLSLSFTVVLLCTGPCHPGKAPENSLPHPSLWCQTDLGQQWFHLALSDCQRVQHRWLQCWLQPRLPRWSWGNGSSPQLRSGSCWPQHATLWYQHHVCIWGVAEVWTQDASQSRSGCWNSWTVTTEVGTRGLQMNTCNPFLLYADRSVCWDRVRIEIFFICVKLETKFNSQLRCVWVCQVYENEKIWCVHLLTPSFTWVCEPSFRVPGEIKRSRDL